MNAPPPPAVAAMPTAMPLLPDQRIGDYDVDRVLGQGVQSAVYGAVHRRSGHVVAIRECLPGRLARRDRSGEIVPADEAGAEALAALMTRFAGDAERLLDIDHPNLVTAREVLRERGTVYLVSDLVHGQTLAEALRLMRLAGEAQLRNLLESLGGALDAIHQAGGVHGGLQPEHVLLTADDVPVLMDFTASRPIGDLNGQVAGELADGYAAPEQYRDDPWTPATDLYALGAVLYRAVSGEPPTRAPERERMKAERTRMRSALEAGSGLFSRRFLRAIDTALILDPGRRAQRVPELLERVESGAAGPEPEALEPREPDLERVETMDFQPVLPAPAGSEVDEVFLEAFRGRLKSRSRPDLERRIGERTTRLPDWRRKPALAVIGSLIVLGALFSTRDSADGEAPPPVSGTVAEPSSAAPVGVGTAAVAPDASGDADRLAPESSAAPPGAVTDAGGSGDAAPAESGSDAGGQAEAGESVSAAAATTRDDSGTSGQGETASVSSSLPSEPASGVQPVDPAAEPATEPPTEPAVAAPRLTAGQQAELEGLLRKAAADIRANRLRSPAGNNAFERLEAARAIAPDDPRVDAGLDAIAEQYLALARSAAGRGQRTRAGTFLDRAESVRPELPAIAAAREELGLR